LTGVIVANRSPHYLGGAFTRNGCATFTGRDIRLEVDGGIKTENIRRVAGAGADTFVAGSAIFGKTDYRATIDSMRAELPRIASAAKVA